MSVVSQFEIERRERQGLVVDDFDGGAAAAEYDDRAESRIVGNAGDQLARFRAQDHRMKGDAGDASVGSRSPRPRENVGDRLAHRVFAGEIEPHPADLGLVHDVRRQDLHHDSRSLGQQGRRDDGGFLGIAGEERGRDRNGIGRQQTRDLDRVQPGASVLLPPVRRSRCATATSGLKSCGRLGGVAINASSASR